MIANFSIRVLSRRRGIALVLVVLVMALAGVMAYAMLSAAAVQATSSANAVAAATARAQAESGIHLAMYYLLNPANAPASFSPPCTMPSVTFATTQPANTIPGNVSITVGSPTNNCYSVAATGSSGGNGAVTRTITAQICLGSEYFIQQAGAFNNGVTIGANATFTSTDPNVPALASNGTVTNNGHVNGNIDAAQVNGNGTQSNGTVNSAPPAPAPYAGTVTDYTQAYVYQGKQCYPVVVGPTISTPASYGPTSSNPLGIYYSTGNLTVSNSLTINGTLIVPGSLVNSNSITITPVALQLSANYPALVVNSKLTMSGHTSSLNATGVVYVGTQIAGSGTNASTDIAINGALLVAGTGFSNYSGQVSVTYNAAYTNIPNFVNAGDTQQRTPLVKIISWSE
jgi:Tfp pilus assembly protein PilX